MKKILAPTSKWAKIKEITTGEFNELLEELGYQERCLYVTAEKKEAWIITELGERHGRKSRNPFKPVWLWDIDTYFQVHKLIGKKKQEYMFCEKCNLYLNIQPGFNFGLSKYVCNKCGHVNSVN